MPERTPEDRLREEYFELLPEIRRVVWQLEAEIRYHTLPILRSLKHYEQLVVKSRTKECESAITTLRDQQEGGTFDPEKPDSYSLLSLSDLAGVRLLAFPDSVLRKTDQALREHFRGWIPDPVRSDDGVILAPTYNGYCGNVSGRVRGEYQVVPMLLGRFWEVEHSAMYKFKAVADFEEMKKFRSDVEHALSRFEDGLESFVRAYTEPSTGNS